MPSTSQDCPHTAEGECHWLLCPAQCTGLALCSPSVLITPHSPRVRMLCTHHPCRFLPPPSLKLVCTRLWIRAEGGLSAAAHTGATPPHLHPSPQ